MADWLHDKDGEPSDEERRLSALLRPMARTPALPPLPARRRVWPWVVAAAAVAAAALVYTLRGPAPWPVEATTGPCAAGGCTLAVGDTLRTDDPLLVELSAGTLQLAAGSVLHRDNDSLTLDRGELGVSWQGEPGAIRVDTAAATVTDLGCAFTLRADDRRVNLHVDDGTVLIENAQGKSYVTGGSVASAEVGGIPTLPVRTDAGPEFVAALSTDVGQALQLARPADVLTLWNLLSRVDVSQRPAVYAAMRRLAPSIPDEPSAALLALDDVARAELWRSLVPYALPNAR